MESVAVLAASSAVSVAVDALSVVAFAASVTLMLVTARETCVPALREGRPACMLVTGVLVTATFADATDRWALVLACLGFLISLQAIALAFGQLAPLRAYLDRRTAGGEAAWWDDFERGFERYVVRRRHLSRLRRLGPRTREAPCSRLRSTSSGASRDAGRARCGAGRHRGNWADIPVNSEILFCREASY